MCLSQCKRRRVRTSSTQGGLLNGDGHDGVLFSYQVESRSRDIAFGMSRREKIMPPEQA